MQLKEGQKWNCPTSIFLCRTNNALNLNSFYIFHSYCFFLSILFDAMFLKVYKCKRKFSKLVGKIKPGFPEKTFDFLSETKDREIKGFVICLAKRKLYYKQHVQYFESIFDACQYVNSFYGTCDPAQSVILHRVCDFTECNITQSHIWLNSTHTV